MKTAVLALACIIPHISVMEGLSGVALRHGVNSITLRFARNFCLSASKWPSLAMMYPGKLTHTTSITASKTSRIRWSSDG